LTQTANFVWAQGEDLPVEMIYKEGATVDTAVPVNLSTGYTLRMDIVVPSTGERIYTFNTAALADVDPGPATVPDNVVEGTLSSGAGGTPNISILVPRSLTLPPSGAIYSKMTGNQGITMFNYDVFLRHVASDRQAKILKGSITIEGSYTLWQ
jgi:hypothetical protein